MRGRPTRRGSREQLHLFWPSQIHSSGDQARQSSPGSRFSIIDPQGRYFSKSCPEAPGSPAPDRNLTRLRYLFIRGQLRHHRTLFVGPPYRLTHGTGSPVNPLAIK